MTWSAVLDTVIGLSFAFLLIATFSAGIVEAISNLLRKRPKMLVRGLTELLATAAPTPVSSKADWLSSQFSSIGTQRAAYRDALSGGAAQHPSPPMAPQARTAPQGTPPGWPPPPGAPPADWSPPAGWTAPPGAPRRAGRHRASHLLRHSRHHHRRLHRHRWVWSPPSSTTRWSSR